jgi:hypothetical protein
MGRHEKKLRGGEWGGTVSPMAEAKSLAGLVQRNVQPADRVRADIGISASDEKVLLNGLHPFDVQQLVQFRQAVLLEFERLIQASRRVATRRDRKVAFSFGQSKSVKERELKITKQQNPRSVNDEKDENTAGSSEAFA